MSYGKFQIYTGDGKGKTTAAIGLSIRAAGRGAKVYFVQFLKNQKTGEQNTLPLIKNITFKRFGFKEFIINNKILKEHIETTKKAILYVDKILNKEKINVLILDELNIILYYNLITIEKVKEIINICKQKNIELIITGRKPNKELIKIADLVTEMKEIKHYFKTTYARKGIEF